MKLRNVTLEISLKSFGLSAWRSNDAVCEEAFSQWQPLLRHAEVISILLWISDGSEILDYRGDPEDCLEWAYWIGAANPREMIANDPDGECLHSRPRAYLSAPPPLKYAQLRELVATIKRVGGAASGRSIRVGATFDPGGEFARSAFKYDRHNEICLADTMGKGSFVCCYATLHADNAKYAGYPDGIPEGLSLGKFLGRQSRHFLADMGFDYLWLSNGFGFGLETWRQTGPLFDGSRFDSEHGAALRDRVIGFWRAFREECSHPVEVRGTNLGTGADLATDAVPLRDIYRGGFGIETRPNSPWAALNGDFGIELVGYMSRVVETATPGGRFPFRFYVHDPWWLNSPWLDRYGREPHDIYLPLSVSRIDSRGSVATPDSVALLTIDDSLGRMPEQCPVEVIPHILEGIRHAPDQPGPLVWVYPFEECHERVFGNRNRQAEPFFNDWFVSGAINAGLPVNTVVSSQNFVVSRVHQPRLYDSSILLAPVPDAGTEVEGALLRHVESGGRLLLYGPVDRSSPALLGTLGVQCTDSLDGEFELKLHINPDTLRERRYPCVMSHDSVRSAGGIDTELTTNTTGQRRILAEVEQNGCKRVTAILCAFHAWTGGQLAWVRGGMSRHPDPSHGFANELLLRFALGQLGLEVAVGKRTPSQRNPVTVISRHSNAFWLSGFVPDTTVELRFRFPFGAPLLTDTDTELIDGRACYRFGRAWRKECRVCVEQQSGAIRCAEHVAPHPNVKRRLLIDGLERANVLFFPEPGLPPTFQPNPRPPYVRGPYQSPAPGGFLTGHTEQAGLWTRNVTGSLLISW